VADVVIAVDLSADILGRHLHEKREPEVPAGEISEWLRKLQGNLSVLLPAISDEEPRLPSMLDVVSSSINIMQVRISRSRMAGDPPDIVVTPRLAHFGLLEFHKAKEAIEEGKHAVESVLPNLHALLTNVRK
jgi:NTE family protein